MVEIELTGLDGTNPLGFLAALGALDTLHRAEREPTLRWTDDLVPAPVLTGAVDSDDLVAVLDADRRRWVDSPALSGPPSAPLDDAKPRPGSLRVWAAEIVKTLDRSRADADLFAALVAEGALDRKNNAKPTHLHFTAGQQLFLKMARKLATDVDPERLHEALFGPWREDSTLPSLSWNPGVERLYALRAVDPATDKKLGVPGADWLALLGLVFFPVRAVGHPDGKLGLETSGCDPDWKSSALRWPLWSPSLSRDVAWSLVGTSELVGKGRARADVLAAWSVRRVITAPIRRSAQGGYGSFGAATVVAEPR